MEPVLTNCQTMVHGEIASKHVLLTCHTTGHAAGHLTCVYRLDQLFPIRDRSLPSGVGLSKQFPAIALAPLSPTHPA